MAGGQEERKAKGENRRRKIKREGGRIGLKFSDNEMSPVIVPAVINGVPLYGGSPCPWESKRRVEGRRREEGRAEEGGDTEMD